MIGLPFLRSGHGTRVEKETLNGESAGQESSLVPLFFSPFNNDWGCRGRQGLWPAIQDMCVSEGLKRTAPLAYFVTPP